jgi:histidine triad (HIT) family protein
MTTAARCVFCAISAGQAAAHVVLEDEACMAFLDARPVFPGHVLVIPRAHYETLMELPPDIMTAIFDRARRLCVAAERALGAQGTFVGMNNRVSQSVPHAHVHVVPRRKGDGLRGFFWPRQKYANEAQAAEIAAKLRDGLV